MLNIVNSSEELSQLTGAGFIAFFNFKNFFRWCISKVAGSFFPSGRHIATTADMCMAGYRFARRPNINS